MTGQNRAGAGIEERIREALKCAAAKAPTARRSRIARRKNDKVRVEP